MSSSLIRFVLVMLVAVAGFAGRLSAQNNAPFGVFDWAASAVDQGGVLSGSGWAADWDIGSPVSQVIINIDGNQVTEANLGEYRPDVASAYGWWAFTYSGWSFNYNISGLSVGTHSVEAWAVDDYYEWSYLGGSTFQVTAVNPSLSIQYLDASGNVLSAQGDGFIHLTVNSSIKVRLVASTANSNVGRLYWRLQKPGNAQGNAPSSQWIWGGWGWGNDVAVSGNPTWTSDLFMLDTVGTWDLWFHAQTAGAGGYTGEGNGWVTVHQPDIIVENSPPPTTSLSASTTSVNAGVSFSVTATTSVTAGALTAHAIDYSIDGGSSWVSGSIGAGTRWEGSAASNTLTPNFVFNSPQTVTFRARGQAASGQLSSFVYVTVTINNTAPYNITLNPSSLAIRIGEGVNLSSSVSDASSNLVNHLLWRRGPRNADTFGQDWNDWQHYWENSNYWSNWTNPGAATGGSQSTISATFTPPSAGYWQFHANAWDSLGAWANGATTPAVFVAPLPVVTVAATSGSQSANGGGSLTVAVGATITISSSATSAGWLSEHTILRYTGTASPSDLNGLVGGTLAADASATGSTRNATWTPSATGTYTIYAEAFTGRTGGERINGATGYPGYFDGAANKRITVTVVTAASLVDSDGDGIPDAIEATLGTNPSSPAQSGSTSLKVHKP